MVKYKKIIFLMIVVLIILVCGIIFFQREKRKDEEELIIERGDGKVERIVGSAEVDEKFIDKNTGEIKKKEMERYIESEIDITKNAIKNFEDDESRMERYENRLIRLNELMEKMKK
jgi:ABC-type Na+ efflux pump permease subunit